MFLKIFQQTAWQIFGKVITVISTFIILGFLARNYGEEGTGIFTLALTYLAIFYLLADFGFNAHVLKNLKSLASSSASRSGQISNVKIEWQRLLGTRLMWSGFLVAVAVGLLPILPFTTPDFTKAVIFGSLAILASGVFVTCNLIFQSKLRYDLSVFSSSIGTIFGLGLFVYLTYLKLSVPNLVFAHLSSWMMIALTALAFVYTQIKVAMPIYDKQYAINLFKSSWPIAATLALNVVYFRADSFMISYFRSNAEVGIYNMAYSVFQTALVLPAFIMNAYYPMMLKSFKGIKFLGVGLFFLSVLGTIITLFTSPLLIGILTGGGFEGSSQALQILSLGFPAYFLSALFMWIYITRGMYKKLLIIYMFGLLINLVLNLIFIPQYSFYAASTITVISEYLILLLLTVSLRV